MPTWTEAERDEAKSRLAAFAGRLPGVQVEDAHGHTGYLVRGKRFAWLLVDHHGDGRLGLCLKAPPAVSGPPRIPHVR